jgi:hypothetical protein
VAIALSEFADAELPQPGSTVLLVAFGGGLSWAAAVLRWADVAAIVARRNVTSLGHSRKTGGRPAAARIAG